MNIDEQSLAELKEIHHKKTDVWLTDDETRKMGENLIRATQLVYQLDSDAYLCHPETKEVL